MRSPFPASSIHGAVLGGAIGDVIGGIPERRTLSFSDDTQLTLATCEAVIGSEEIRPERVAERMLVWFRERRITGIGSSTLKALRDLAAGAHWALSGARGERAAGNGAAMRIAPVAFFLDPAIADQRTTIRDIARITHHHDEAYVGALAVVIAVRAAASRELAPLTAVGERLPDSRVKDNVLKLASHPKRTAAGIAELVGSSGFSAETVPFALSVAPLMVRDGVEATLHAVNRVGGDTDTIGSIAGQIAGAYIGVNDLPKQLLSSVPKAEQVFAIASEFAQMGAMVQGGSPRC